MVLIRSTKSYINDAKATFRLQFFKIITILFYNFGVSIKGNFHQGMLVVYCIRVDMCVILFKMMV